MLSYIIKGGNKLNGRVKAAGSKNAALPIIATAILNKEPVTLYNIPDIEDTKITLEILKILGCKIVRNSDKITICSANMNKTSIPKDLMHKLRSTVVLAGAIIGRFKEATFAYPGGCNIGARPIDLHLDSFKKLGIAIEEKEDYIHCKCKEIVGRRIKLKFPSVGATENIILASIYAKGATHITNAAKEPEIKDLAKCLNSMGAKVYGAGTSEITIFGVKKLHKTEYKIMSDRIETGTILAAVAGVGGSVTVENTNPENLLTVLYSFKEMGCKISIRKDKISLKAPEKLKHIDISTEPYPGFPTDMQPIIGSILIKAEGKSTITENIFENRFKYAEELVRMGANITQNDKKLEIVGVDKLEGKDVMSKDLRGGAALVIAGLMSEGVTKVENIEYILRGYENLDTKLKSLGANIEIKKEKVV